MAAIMDNSPRTGISFFIGAEPLGNAPAHITTAQNAAPSAPREKIPMTYSLTKRLEISMPDCNMIMETAVRTPAHKRQSDGFSAVYRGSMQ